VAVDEPLEVPLVDEALSEVPVAPPLGAEALGATVVVGSAAVVVSVVVVVAGVVVGTGA
jgi:hypothetical protein